MLSSSFRRHNQSSLQRTFLTSRRVFPTSRPRNLLFLDHKFSRSLNTNQYSRYVREVRGKKIFIWSCIGINVLVWGSWAAAQSFTPNMNKEQQVRRLQLLSKLRRNFTISAQNIKEGRWFTMITCGFSHLSIIHLGVNMFTFHQLSQIMVAIPGLKALRHLTPLIFGSIFSGSAAFLAHENFRPANLKVQRYGYGFSAAVSGVVTAAACLMPHQKMLLMGFIPLPLWALGIGFVVYDTYSIEGDSTIGHDAHVGGALFGGLFYALVLKKFGGVLNPRATWR